MVPYFCDIKQLRKTASTRLDPERQLALRQFKAAVFQALGHPTRVKIIRILRAEGTTCTALVERLSLAQSTVSEHLRLLREAGIVTVADAGRVYQVDVHRVRRLKALVGSL